MTRSIQCLVLTLACLVPIGTAQAIESRTDKRVLAGHTFMPSENLRQPFMTRDYSMIMGVGVSKVDIPGSTDLDLVAMAMETTVQQPFNDRLGFRFNLLGAVFSGVDSDAAFIFGADGAWELGAGAYWNLVDSERFSLTATLDMDGGQDYNLNPLTAITTAVDEGAVTTEGLLIKTKSFSMRAGATGAVGISELVGLYADVAYSLENDNPSIGSTDTNNYLEFGIGLSLNFETLDLPIGITTTYLRDQALGGDKLSTDNLEFGLYYAPNAHFAFGLTTQGQLLDFDEGVELTTWTGIIGMTYYQ